MSGSRLEVKVHIVTGAQSAAENIIKCVRRCGLEVDQLMLNPSASSHAVLTDDEKDLGVALVDIGAGTTDVAIFTDGAIRHTAVIPIAGDLITSDIAMALRTPTKDAEEIKVEYGVAKQLLADPDEQVEVPGLGDRGAAHAEPAGAGRRDRAARRGDLLAGAPGDPRVAATRRCCRRGIVHHRRQRGDAGHGRARRGHLPEAGAQGHRRRIAARCPTWSRNPRSATVMGLLEEARLARMRGQQGGAAGRLGEDRVRPRQGLLRGELLMRID